MAHGIASGQVTMAVDGRTLDINGALTLVGHVHQTTVNIKMDNEMDIQKPDNSIREIKEITDYFFAGKDLEIRISGKWVERDVCRSFPDFARTEYRIKQEIPEGYEEIDYRAPVKGERYLNSSGQVDTIVCGECKDRQIILRKKRPEFKVGQVWIFESQDPDGYGRLMITGIQDEKIYHLDYRRNGEIWGHDCIDSDDPRWDDWELLVDPEE